ncbi:hypothetical protein LOCC1_G001413 [Lachnellula occidentalis]|uniref:Uncharacterized protein n=1 Tax=Lachnellula occidentalis TaxID=215460 RepID=A0A8H8UKD0_9HELO|nr:hypothetical protein LOCC1_G001413 [Lachnellula occidentalis]
MSNPTPGPQTMNSPLRDPTIHITTHNPSGRAIIHSSLPSPGIPYPAQKAVLNLLYTTSSIPADLNNEVDITTHTALAASGTMGFVNPNGTVCRIVDFAPGNIGMMHRTQSLDYAVVLEGNVLLELDDGSSTLIARGDVAIQRATIHAWKNASETEWARILFVLQDCMPIIAGGRG